MTASIERGNLAADMRRADGRAVRWRVLEGLAPYAETLAAMERAADAIARGEADEQVWLLEHPSLYTAGTKADPRDLVAPDRLPVHRTGRGGQYTWHGPGQRVAYAMLDLRARQQDVRAYVAALEDWLIGALDRFNVRGERREERVGVWVARPERPAPAGTVAEDKVAAIGIRIRRWVTFHGVALNVEPDLTEYAGIVPCGVSQHGVTSLVDLGLPVTMADADVALRASFEDVFGPTET